jgi:hypothetical protein
MINLNDVDGPLQNIKYMAEVAADLVDNLDSNDARSGFFEISKKEGNRLAFACNDTLRRVEKLIASVVAIAKK